jgi:catalase
MGRTIGCLIADGCDSELVLGLSTAVANLGADFKIIAPKVGGAVASDGKLLEADFQLAGGPSVLFDHVFVALSAEAGNLLSTEAAAVAWVHDAYSHLKVIGATDGSQPLLDAAGVLPDDGVMGIEVEAFLAQAAKGKLWDREPTVRTIY